MSKITIMILLYVAAQKLFYKKYESEYLWTSSEGNFRTLAEIGARDWWSYVDNKQPE